MEFGEAVAALNTCCLKHQDLHGISTLEQYMVSVELCPIGRYSFQKLFSIFYGFIKLTTVYKV